jgi:ectoine hydroxylase-related dioxygenase (phytanoyl-CoA dioxygenase family)
MEEVTNSVLEAQGYLVLQGVLQTEELKYYRIIYEDFLSGVIDTSDLRSDLSGMTREKGRESIVQVMRPSMLVPSLQETALYARCTEKAREWLGDDMALDFDMLIDKPPHSDAITPWHQDEAYWIDMPDKRALSFWVALDEATVDNGCMWYVPGSHKGRLLSHRQMPGGGALYCEEGDERDGEPVPLSAGDCVVHTGRTLHYSRGNTTDRRRRAYILNFRPRGMIEMEREAGFDHTGRRKNRQEANK